METGTVSGQMTGCAWPIKVIAISLAVIALAGMALVGNLYRAQASPQYVPMGESNILDQRTGRVYWLTRNEDIKQIPCRMISDGPSNSTKP